MIDILDEIQDDIKNEKTIKLIKQGGIYIISVMVTLLLLMSGYIGFKSYQENKIENSGEKFLLAVMKMKTTKLNEAMQAFEVIASNGTAGYAALSILNEASYEQAKRDYVKAAASYKKIFTNNKFDVIFREYAELEYFKALLSDETTNKKEVVERLRNFIEGEKTFKASALELLAALQIELGLRQDALETVGKLLTDPNIPNTIKIRAEQLMNFLS